MLNIFGALLRKIWRAITILWRLVAFSLKGSTILLVSVMLLLNVATLSISTLNAAASAALTTIAGISTVSSRQRKSIADAETRAAKLGKDLTRTQSALSSSAQERKLLSEKHVAAERQARKLRTEAKLFQTALAIEGRKSTATAKRLGVAEMELRRLRTDGPNVNFRGRQRSLRSVAAELTQSVARRTAKVTTMNIGSMYAEGIPFYGIAVIVAATTIEASAACDTMQDMHDLEVALNPNLASSTEASEVCGMRVPTRGEVWEKIKNGPVQIWGSATETFANLPSPDFNGWWGSIVARLGWE